MAATLAHLSLITDRSDLNGTLAEIKKEYTLLFLIL